MEFKTFDDFRRTFWKLVAEDLVLCKSFDVDDILAMKTKGIAPAAPKEQWLGKTSSYQLHHKKPIHDNGAVYDFDNILIVTPKLHKEILEPKYHFNRYE